MIFQIYDFIIYLYLFKSCVCVWGLFFCTGRETIPTCSSCSSISRRYKYYVKFFIQLSFPLFFFVFISYFFVLLFESLLLQQKRNNNNNNTSMIEKYILWRFLSVKVFFFYYFLKAHSLSLFLCCNWIYHKYLNYTKIKTPSKFIYTVNRKWKYRFALLFVAIKWIL